MFLDQGTQVARLGELVEVSLHPAEAQVYQVQGAPSPTQVDPVAKKRKGADGEWEGDGGEGEGG